MKNNFVFEPNLAAKTIHIVREFNAPVEKLWRAWTEADIIDKWIAPKPWRAETKSMDFRVGGIWLYAMVGNDGQKHWTQMEYSAIDKGRSFSAWGMFCDADGNPVKDGPKSHRVSTFTSIGSDRSKVDSLITFEQESTFGMFVQGDFEKGTAAGFATLDELFATNQMTSGGE